MLKITPINGVRKPTIWLKLLQYFKGDQKMYMQYLRANTHKKFNYLNQAKNGACVMFGFAGASMYNTDLLFTSEEVLRMAKEANALDGAVAWQIGEMFATAYNLSLVTFKNPFDPDAQKALDLGYALGVSTRFPLKFYADGIVDGKVDKEYEKNIKNTPAENTIMAHFMYLIKDGDKYCFVNSWGDYTKKGMHNKYQVDMKLLADKNLLWRECFLLA